MLGHDAMWAAEVKSYVTGQVTQDPGLDRYSEPRGSADSAAVWAVSEGGRRSSWPGRSVRCTPRASCTATYTHATSWLAFRCCRRRLTLKALGRARLLGAAVREEAVSRVIDLDLAVCVANGEAVFVSGVAPVSVKVRAAEAWKVLNPLNAARAAEA